MTRRICPDAACLLGESHRQPAVPVMWMDPAAARNDSEELATPTQDGDAPA